MSTTCLPARISHIHRHTKSCRTYDGSRGVPATTRQLAARQPNVSRRLAQTLKIAKLGRQEHRSPRRSTRGVCVTHPFSTPSLRLPNAKESSVVSRAPLPVPQRSPTLPAPQRARSPGEPRHHGLVRNFPPGFLGLPGSVLDSITRLLCLAVASLPLAWPLHFLVGLGGLMRRTTALTIF